MAPRRVCCRVRQVSGAAGQQLQPAFQPSLHGGGREQFDARRRQFDGQRQAVQAGADGRRPRPHFPRSARNRASRPARVPGTERNRRILWRALDRWNWTCEIRQVQRRHGKFVFAVNMQRRPAGDQDLELRRCWRAVPPPAAPPRPGARSCRAGAAVGRRKSAGILSELSSGDWPAGFPHAQRLRDRRRESSAVSLTAARGTK